MTISINQFSHRQQKFNKANSKIHVCYDLLPLGCLIVAITVYHKYAFSI
jgi:hypothetical protein